MESYKINWTQKENTGTMIVTWWIEKGRVQVELEGDIPNVMEFKGQVPSREASKAGYELMAREAIKRQLNEQGYDF